MTIAKAILQLHLLLISGGLCRLAAWHLSGGLVGPPAMGAAQSNVEGWSGTEQGALARKRRLSSDELFAGARSV